MVLQELLRPIAYVKVAQDPPSLGVKVQEQEVVVWCWASAAAAIFNFYERPMPSLDKCFFVSKHLNEGNDCCITGAPDRCKNTFQVDVALGAHAGQKRKKAIKPKEIDDEVNSAKRPLVCIMNLPDGAAHCVILDGSAECAVDGKPEVALHFIDPLGGAEKVRFWSKVTKPDPLEEWFWDGTILTK